MEGTLGGDDENYVITRTHAGYFQKGDGAFLWYLEEYVEEEVALLGEKYIQKRYRLPGGVYKGSCERATDIVKAFKKDPQSVILYAEGGGWELMTR
jgi:hypothetical protein